MEHRALYAELIDAGSRVDLSASRDEVDVELERVERAIGALRGGTVRFRLPSDAGGGSHKLFPRHALGAAEIRAGVLSQLGVDLPEALLGLREPIREFGEHQVPLRFTVPSDEGLPVQPSLSVVVRRVTTRRLAKGAEDAAPAPPA